MRWAMMSTLMVAASCGGQTDNGADASPDSTLVDALTDALSMDASVDGGGAADATAEKQWPIVYNIVDGGGDGPECYPDGNVQQACCNGQSCRGFCVLDDDGSVECSCYGIPGGCVGWADSKQTIPNVCCIGYRGCAGLYDCVPQKGN